MTKRSMLMVLMSCVALAMAPMMGCGADDPTVNQNSNGDGDNGDGPGDGLSDLDGDGENGDGENGDGENGDGENGDGENGDGENGDGTDNCVVDAEFFGQTMSNAEFSGGTAMEGNFPDDANIKAIYEFLDAQESLEGEIFLNEPIQITGATIISTGFGAFNSVRRIWLQDSERGIFLYRRPGNAPENPEEGVPEQAFVGQKVSFQVDSLEVFSGTPQIRQFSNWTVDSENNPVYFEEIGDGPLVEEDHFLRNIRIAGRIGERENPACGGGNQCYDFSYGPNEEYTITFRVGSAFNVFDGECLTFFGPAGAFPAPYDSREFAWQLDTPNFAWARVQFSNPFD